jgi:hypothetical protein
MVLGMYTPLIIIVIVLLVCDRTLSSSDIVWNDIKLKEGVIRDIIYPKSGNHASKNTVTDTVPVNTYMYGPDILMTLTDTCFNATYIPEHMGKTGNGRPR